MGCDPMAVDANCCRLLRLDPEKFGCLIVGYQKKLGVLREGEIAQRGEKIADLAQSFTTVPHFEPLRLVRSA